MRLSIVIICILAIATVAIFVGYPTSKIESSNDTNNPLFDLRLNQAVNNMGLSSESTANAQWDIHSIGTKALKIENKTCNSSPCKLYIGEQRSTGIGTSCQCWDTNNGVDTCAKETCITCEQTCNGPSCSANTCEFSCGQDTCSDTCWFTCNHYTCPGDTCYDECGWTLESDCTIVTETEVGRTCYAVNCGKN